MLTDEDVSYLFSRYYRLPQLIFFDSVNGLNITRTELMEILDLHPRAPYDGKIAVNKLIQKKMTEKSNIPLL